MTDGETPDRLDEAEIGRRVRETVAAFEVPTSLIQGTFPRRPRRTDGLRTALTATVGLLAIVAVANLSGPASQPAATPIGSPTASFVQATDGSAPATLPDIGEFTWFTVETIGPCPVEEQSAGMSACNEASAPRLAKVFVEAASLDGRGRVSTSIELSGVDRPSELERVKSVAFLGTTNQVLYTTNDSNGGAIRSLELSTGADSERLRTRDLIQDAVYDPRSDSVLAAMVAGNDRADAGIWRLTLDSDAAERLVAPGNEQEASARGEGWSRRLFLTPDSKLFVSLDCGNGLCDARVFDSEDGSHVSSAAGLRDETVFGLTTNALVGILDCPERPCRVSAMALATGVLNNVFEPCDEAGAALAAAGEDDTARLAYGAVAAERCVLGDVSAIDVQARSVRPIWTSVSSPNLAIVERGPGLGYSAPPGWVAIGPGGGFVAQAGEVATPLLLNLGDGRTIPLMGG